MLAIIFGSYCQKIVLESSKTKCILEIWIRNRLLTDVQDEADSMHAILYLAKQKILGTYLVWTELTSSS